MFKPLVPFLMLAAATAGVQAPANAQTAPTGAMNPARTLDCTLGRATNLDPERDQTLAEIRHEGAHRFSLFLPARAQHVGPPPDPAAEPDPFDPATRITADPASLAGDMPGGFYRVADLWPQRVELVGRIAGSQLVRFIVISEIDLLAGTANLFMTRAADAASIDLAHVYQGGCRITGAIATGPSSHALQTVMQPW